MPRTSQPVWLLAVDQVLRDRKPKKTTPKRIKGIVNLYAATAGPGEKLIPFSKGINPMAEIKGPNGARRPAILISSSPHKSGSVVTPWQDVFEPDEGFIRYFGDAKRPGERAHEAPGNKALLHQFECFHGHDEQDQRARATPLVYFQRQPHDGNAKGYPRFQGFGIITGARLVTQHSDHVGAFSNYQFEFAVFGMDHEDECFDWRWINSRRNPSISDSQGAAEAPRAWREWINNGEAALPRLRRKVIRRELVPVKEQIPTKGSADERLLKKIYSHYSEDGKKVYFESLAAAVAEQVIAPSGSSYKTHGVTRGAGDFGIDFISQLNIGHGFSRTPLVVLGQAKCVQIGGSINARDLARTVARLRRGWLGVFVTTGVVTRRAQMEVYEDRYPLLLITGRQVVEVVKKMLHDSNHLGLGALLKHFDEEYEIKPRVSDPERLIS